VTRFTVILGALACFGLASSSAFALTAEEEALYGLEQGRPNWRLQTDDGLTLVFERLFPDMVRTFYINRGFKLDAANRYAGTCVYKSVLKNSGKGKMEVNLRDWQVLVDGKPRLFKIEPDWQKDWEKMSVSKSARIAFTWSQMRPVQVHGPEDWLQGMSNMDLEPNTRYDMKVVWKRDGKKFEAILKNIECGPPEKE